MSNFWPKSMSAMGGRRARQRIEELKARRMELLRDLMSRDRPKSPEEHAECIGISRELEGIQAEITELEG